MTAIEKLIDLCKTGPFPDLKYYAEQAELEYQELKAKSEPKETKSK